MLCSFILLSLYCYSFQITRPTSAAFVASNNLVFLDENCFISSLYQAKNVAGFGFSYNNYFSFFDFKETTFLFSSNTKHFSYFSFLRAFQHEMIKNYDLEFGISKDFTNLALGFSCKCCSEEITNFKQKSIYTYNISAAYNYDMMKIACSIHNLTKSSYENIIYPTIVLFEHSFDLEKFIFSYGFEKETDLDFTYKSGFSYLIQNNLKLVFSHQWNPDRFGTGFSFKIKKWLVYYGIRTHSTLDLSHAISTEYRF